MGKKRFGNNAIAVLPLFAVTTIILAACGGGGGSSGDTGNSPSVTSPASSSGGSSSSSSSSSSSGGASAQRYSDQPNVASCYAGKLLDSEKQLVLSELNSIRARHGLPAVTYDSASDNQTAQAALMMVANNELNHQPPKTWKCYTSDGATGAGSSNLAMWWSSGSTLSVDSTWAVEGFLIDSGVSSLGHRRWVLDPFMSSVSFGRVDSNGTLAGALKVIGSPAQNLSSYTNLNFVAYPYGDYPVKLYDGSQYFSFTVIADRSSEWANDNSAVNLDNATISVKDASGNALTVSGKATDYTGYGVPNILQWQVAGLKNNVQYTVTIGNVTVKNVVRSYSYTFRITSS